MFVNFVSTSFGKLFGILVKVWVFELFMAFSKVYLDAHHHHCSAFSPLIRTLHDFSPLPYFQWGSYGSCRFTFELNMFSVLWKLCNWIVWQQLKPCSSSRCKPCFNIWKCMGKHCRLLSEIKIGALTLGWTRSRMVANQNQTGNWFPGSRKPENGLQGLAT